MIVTRAASRVLVAGLLTAGAPLPVLAQQPAAADTQARGAAEAYYEFLMARRLESQGDRAGALEALRRAAAADPRSAMIRAEIAAFQLRRNRRDEAEAAAREALALDAGNPDAHRVLGFVHAARAEGPGRNGPPDAAANVDEAISHFEQALAGNATTSDINLLYTLGRLYMRKGDGDKAVQTLTRVVGLNPGSAQARLSLAQAQATAGNMAGAIQTLEEIAADEPRVAAALGQYLEQAGRPADAARAYASALEVTPMSAEIKFRRAAALFSARQYADAADAAATAQSEHPDDLRFPRLRARALAESGAAARAIEVLEPAARANPDDLSTQLTLADLYNSANRAGDAERTLRQLLAIEPRNADALNYLGYLLAERGQQLDEAIRLVRQALEIEPDNPSFLDSLGWAYFRQGNAAEAEKYLTPAAEKLPRNSGDQEHMGDDHADRGRWADAIASWQRALDGDGDDIDRAAIQQKIERARTRVP
ncbi:MAG: tetratricopeptide repeat protein [Vicinamibacterales bacterium]